MNFSRLKLRGGSVGLFVVGAIAALGLNGCPKPGVTIETYSIQIHPATKISYEDYCKMVKILNNSNRKDLYKIETYHENKENKPDTIGQLADGWIAQALAEEVAQYAPLGHPNASLQIGIWGHPEVNVKSGHPNKQGKASGHPTVSQQDWAAAARLVEEITPIVQKYRRADKD